MKIGFQNARIMIFWSRQAKIALLFVLAVTAVAADSIHAADCTSRIYGTAYDGPNAPAIFYSIDINNGAGNQIGPVGFDRISAMDVDPTSGIVYAIAERHSDDQTMLISIDRLNGVGTQVAEVSFGTAPDFEHIAGMAFNSLGKLYGFGSNDQGFYEIDVSNGTVVLLGVNDLGLPGNGLAFSPSDILYHADDEFLSTVNLATGALTHVNDLTFNFATDAPKVAAMDYGPETGLYYAIVKDGAEVSLATVNVGTGAVDWIGFTADYMDGMAYFFCEPVITDASIEIEKATNGFDADTGTGPLLGVGQAVTWTYVVTNTGSVRLDPVVVKDNIAGVSPVCDASSLEASASLTCSASGVATAGQYANVGTATGTPPEGDDVVDTDPSHYFGAAAAIAIEKATNGFDADSGTGPLLGVGQAVTWTYVVTNTGNVRLDPVVVKDNIAGVSPVCDATSLEVGAFLTCSASGVATAGQYANVGTATGTPPVGDDVVDTDPSHYFGAAAAIAIEKATNGFDADTGTGPLLDVGQAVTWTYVVTNTGSVKLDPVVVKDNIAGVSPVCGATSLEAGASLTCSASGVATAGQYANLGTATGTPPEGDDVVATDPSHYFGVSDFDFDYSFNGNWWNGPDRSGEGIQVEIADSSGGSLIMVTTVYSYNTMGEQIFMITVGPVIGNSAAVDVFITEGGLWGDDFDPELVKETQWGTGTFSASSCDAMHMELKPNAEYQAKGYTNLAYDLVRLTTPVVPCPIDNPN